MKLLLRRTLVRLYRYSAQLKPFPKFFSAKERTALCCKNLITKQKKLPQPCSCRVIQQFRNVKLI